jgi:hypothetical protein
MYTLVFWVTNQAILFMASLYVSAPAFNNRRSFLGVSKNLGKITGRQANAKVATLVKLVGRKFASGYY